MLSPSPDWFVGVSGLLLHDGSNWIDNLVIDLRPYDGGVRDIGFESHQIAFVMHYRFGVSEFVHPYIGARLAIGFALINDEKLERRRPRDDFSPSGFTIGAAGIVGLDFPLNHWLTVYTKCAREKATLASVATQRAITSIAIKVAAKIDHRRPKWNGWPPHPFLTLVSRSGLVL